MDYLCRIYPKLLATGRKGLDIIRHFLVVLDCHACIFEMTADLLVDLRAQAVSKAVKGDMLM